MPIIGVEIIRTTDEREMPKNPRKNTRKTNRDRQEQREKEL